MVPLTQRIYVLGQTLGHAADVVLRRETGLGFSEFLFLTASQSRPTASQAELARDVGVGTAGASRIVERLVARGLLDLDCNPQDRRRNLVAPTAAGAELAARASTLLEDRFRGRIGQALTPDRLAAFEAALEEIRHALEPRT
jgi:DNA-binding MarR family transcriptional regulator